MNLRYRDERHTHARPKHLPSINTTQEQARSPHDLAGANPQVLILGAAVHDATAYSCTSSVRLTAWHSLQSHAHFIVWSSRSEAELGLRDLAYQSGKGVCGVLAL